MTSCPYCLRSSSCRHRDPPVAPRARSTPHSDTSSSGIVDRGAAQEDVSKGLSLFELHGKLLDLRCTLCGVIIESGKLQHINRLIHGNSHVLEGRCVAIAVAGLQRERGVRFEVRHER